MSRRRRGGAAVVAVGLTLLVGCSGAGGEQAAPSAPPPSPSATATAAASPPASPPSSPGPSSPAPATVPATPVEATGADAAVFGGLRDLPDPVAAVAEADVEVSGTPVAAASWDDANGQNLAVLSTSAEEGEAPRAVGGPATGTTTRLFAAHHVLEEGGSQRLREVADVVEDCAFDTSAYSITGNAEQVEASQTFDNPRIDDPALASQVRGPLEVTDLDGDQVAELTFAYALGCRSDVSPLTFKLLVLEDGEKYILRGDTWGGPGSAGRRTPSIRPSPSPPRPTGHRLSGSTRSSATTSTPATERPGAAS